MLIIFDQTGDDGWSMGQNQKKASSQYKKKPFDNATKNCKQTEQKEKKSLTLTLITFYARKLIQ